MKTQEEIFQFLRNNGIEAKILLEMDGILLYNRKIQFFVYDIEYIIEWWKNESYLQIGNHPRAARIPFKYMYVDTTYPLIDGNKSIGFYYTKKEKINSWDTDSPYESFRIPVEI